MSETLSQKYTRLANTKSGVSRVGWLDALQQGVQFEILLDLTISPTASILDVGCGTGDLLATLINNGFEGAYTGIDLHPPFIAEAQNRFAERPQTCFIAGDSTALDLAPHDFIFSSGLFDYATPDSLKRWQRIIQQLWPLANLALAWNGYYQQPANRRDMWAADLAAITDACQTLSNFWHLRADYAPSHYTATIFKPAYWLTPAVQTLIGHLFLNPALRQQLKTNPHHLAHQYGLTLQHLNFLEPLLQ